MTPIAQKLLKQQSDKSIGLDHLMKRDMQVLTTMRCFDCTAVSEMAHDLAHDMLEKERLTSQLAFLPAPATWIEYIKEGGGTGTGPAMRIAYLLQETQGGTFTSVSLASFVTKHFAENENITQQMAPFINKVIIGPMGELQLRDQASFDGIEMSKWTEQPAPDAEQAAIIYALLAIINTPHFVGRREHQPHTGLQRQLRQELGQKDLTLLPWTEILLQIRDHRAGASAQGDTLTGQKAFHFVRSFLRVRLGKLELVKAHSRGNPDIGIRQTSYRVVQ